MKTSARKLNLTKLPFQILGLVLFLVGLLDWLAQANIVPSSLRFDNYPIIFIIAGILLIYPHKQPFDGLDDPHSD